MEFQGVVGCDFCEAACKLFDSFVNTGLELPEQAFPDGCQFPFDFIEFGHCGLSCFTEFDDRKLMILEFGFGVAEFSGHFDLLCGEVLHGFIEPLVLLFVEFEFVVGFAFLFIDKRQFLIIFILECRLRFGDFGGFAEFVVEQFIVLFLVVEL